MRAFTLDALDTAPALRDLPEPTPGDGELLVRVQASSANPVDNAIAAGMLAGMVEHEFPALLDRLGEQLAAGTLQVRIQQTYPLEQAGEALVALAGTHTQGKLAISLG